jgi:Ras-related protein Rab-7A
MGIQNRKIPVLKIIILGDSGVGKTSLLKMYVNRQFSLHYASTIGADFLTKTITYKNRMVVLQIWDTAGQEKFFSLGTAFYRGADACIFVYDVTNQESFNHLDMWRDDFITKSLIEPDDLFLPLMVVANKIDIPDSERRVDKQKAIQYTRSNNLLYEEVSAKENICVEHVFQVLVHKIFLSYWQEPSEEEQVNLTQQDESTLCSC